MPLLQLLDGWRRDALNARLALTLTPTLCAMLQDPLLQDRYARHLNELIELAGKENHRTRWEKALHELAQLYHRRLIATRDAYVACGRDLVHAFRQYQESGHLEIITSPATHALLSRDDVIIVASVSCIYGSGAPEEWASQLVVVQG